jgi:hypothetical protein
MSLVRPFSRPLFPACTAAFFYGPEVFFRVDYFFLFPACAAVAAAGRVPFSTPAGTGTARPEHSSPRRQTKLRTKLSSFWKAIWMFSHSGKQNRAPA